MSKTSLQEKYWIFKIKHSKDPDAYGKLYDLYIGRIFRFVLFKVSSVEEAEDITSEVFLKVWNYIRTTSKRIDNLNALLYRMARNAVIDYYRDKRRTEKPLSSDEQFRKIETERDLDKEIDQKIEIKNIQSYLNQIKDEYREVIILRYVEDYSVNEIAEILKKSKGNVRVLVHRALNQIRELMEEN
jgi:RNA polymerase sigma-70 factor (ECF subfamily)